MDSSDNCGKMLSNLILIILIIFGIGFLDLPKVHLKDVTAAKKPSCRSQLTINMDYFLNTNIAFFPLMGICSGSNYILRIFPIPSYHQHKYFHRLK